jgi:hypothetical protein
MTRVKTLREQAGVLRSLANSFDDIAIRRDLTNLAQQCEELAAQLEQRIREDLSKAKSDNP